MSMDEMKRRVEKIEAALGPAEGEAGYKAEDFVSILPSEDLDRYEAALLAKKEGEATEETGALVAELYARGAAFEAFRGTLSAEDLARFPRPGSPDPEKVREEMLRRFEAFRLAGNDRDSVREDS